MSVVYTMIFLSYLSVLHFHNYKFLKTMHALRRARPYYFWGQRVQGLKSFVGNETELGYLTDRSDQDILGGRIFSQTQYALAPIILDYNNPNHRYVLLDFNDPRHLVQAIQNHNLTPIKINNTGLVLAENRHNRKQ